MKRPPRNLRQSIFSTKTVAINFMQGFGVLVATFILFALAVKFGRSEAEARSIAFVSLVLGNVMLIATNLSWSRALHAIFLSANRVFFIVTFGALLCLFAVLYVPFFAGLFHLAPLHIADLALIGIAIFASILWFEALKFFNARRGQGLLA